ncbi:hypothetical protein [Mycoplasmopsis agassizii]|uniref:Lipoprotein associated domain n=1 Tax=Mycoplasmopsis agassizii TaxID=33922 RepID=A0ABX4H5V3_9BACT|nr:hypothetical protein [Mycoplasmopsis agassizii]PAF55250.1 hypothetical protein CJF60_01005 [Mycoplasmopsis agassizii]SMC15668.1 hypothetical protein SAMN02745179_00018 [Mycoplasmopsis agassizii]
MKLFAKSNPNVTWQVGEIKLSTDNGLEVVLSAKIADLEANGTLKISGTSTTDIRTTNEESTASKTDQEKVSEYALNLSISSFEISEDKTLATLLTEVNAAEGATKLELLKSASSLLTFYLNGLTGVEVTVSQATTPIENRLSASVSLKLNEATASSTINLIPKAAEKTEAEKDVTVSDRATIDAITKALNAQTFKSAKNDIKSGLVYADYLLKSQTNEEKLNLVKEYVTTLPSELKAEMIISLVIAQPSQFSDKLTVEIVFAKGNQLGVTAFVIEGFINTKEQFNSYWKNVSDTFDANPLTVKEQISAKTFNERIKSLDTANKIYELAKLVNGEDANTKNSFAELVTPIPTQYGAIKNIDFVYNEATVESEAGSFSITVTTKFDNVDQSAQLKVTGFLSVNAESDINKGNNGEGEAKSDQEQGALDKETLENLLTVNMFNLKSGIGIVKAVDSFKQIEAKNISQADKVKEYFEVLKTSINASEVVKLLSKETVKVKSFSFINDLKATSSTEILSVSFEVQFGEDPANSVNITNIPLIGIKSLSDFEDESNMVEILLPDTAVKNFIETERATNIWKYSLDKTKTLLANLEKTDLGAFLFNLKWTDLSIEPADDQTEDTLKVSVKVVSGTETYEDGTSSDTYASLYFTLKFGTSLAASYPNVAITKFIKAVESRLLFIKIAESGWAKSKVSSSTVAAQLTNADLAIGLFYSNATPGTQDTGKLINLFQWYDFIKASGRVTGEINIDKKEIYNSLWILETPASKRTIGDNGAYNLFMRDEVDRLYIFSAENDQFFGYAGLGADIVMFDKQNRRVPYSEKGLGRIVKYQHYDWMAWTYQYQFYTDDLYYAGVVYW